MTTKLDTIKAEAPKSEHGNFRVKYTYDVPHPYCITFKHVAEAADHHAGMLDEAAIEAAERNGAKCGICHGQLSYKQHETAVVIECDYDVNKNPEHEPELRAYLLKLQPLIEAAAYTGFVLAMSK